MGKSQSITESGQRECGVDSIGPGYYWFRCINPVGDMGEWSIVKIDQHPSFAITRHLVVHFFGGGAAGLTFLLKYDTLKAEFEKINAR